MDERPVLILGGGVNGAATARELALNGMPVVLVDTADLAFGASAYSSRLIHGGLRYLEYGEFSLVRESLEERARLLKLAPHLVRPLRLFVPVRNRWSGLAAAGARFVGLNRSFTKWTGAPERGLFLIRTGLWMYDTFARDATLPRRSLHRRGDPGAPQISHAAGAWMCAYSDAQITFPERLVVDLLLDAKRLAEQQGIAFHVRTYHRAVLQRQQVVVEPLDGGGQGRLEFEPAAIINATGASVDRTLARLQVPSRQLMGGTKGSHIFTWNTDLRERLQGQAIYTEARDGRPVFLLPYLEGTLIGTTDIPFEGDPAKALASPQELDYLLQTTQHVFDGLALGPEDIALHYCGVRPLPYADAATPAAITRRHQLVWNNESPLPLVSLVGGKLTTCRSLGEETARAVLQRLERKLERTTRDRPLPAGNEAASIADTIETEWVTRLEDLVERRLMLLYDRQLSTAVLDDLAQQLVAAGRLSPAQVPAAIAACIDRLQSHFGRKLAPPIAKSPA